MEKSIIPAQVTLAALREGQVMNELAQAFADAGDAVKHHNKPATITLEIKVSPIKNMGAHLADHPITMVAEVTTKLPKNEPDATVFFVGDNGPTRNMTPRQQPLSGIGGVVDPETGEIKHG